MSSNEITQRDSKVARATFDTVLLVFVAVVFAALVLGAVVLGAAGIL